MDRYRASAPKAISSASGPLSRSQMHKKAILRRNLSALGIDGLLITDLVNVRYLTGFTGSSGYLLITGKNALFVTDFRYMEQAHEEVKGFRIRIERSERSGEIRGEAW